MSDRGSQTTSDAHTPYRAELPTALVGLREPLIAVVLAAAWLCFLMWPGVVLFPGGAPRENQVEPARAPQANPTAPAASPQSPTPNVGPLPHSETPPIGAPSSGRLQPGALADTLDNSVVMIAGTDATGKPGGGTGFFVSPNLIVTNRHVIENLDPSSLKVASKRLQPSQRPRIVAKSLPGQTLQVRDLALLSVDQPGKGFLRLGPSPTKLTPIVAAGYPESVLDLDSMIATGIINQKPESLPVKFLTHSAMIGKGGAGGPIVDLCGRVVGVNTAAVNESNGGDTSASLAQDVSELSAFLSVNNSAVTADEAACPTNAPSASAPAVLRR